jgi:hypothetical protein
MDKIVHQVIIKYLQRSYEGQQKYGTTLDRNDLLMRDWMQHLQEELMDASLYLEKLMTVIDQLEELDPKSESKPNGTIQ